MRSGVRHPRSWRSSARGLARDQVRALTRGPADYRHAHLQAHDLEEIVTDPAAPAERRIAAVMALSGDAKPETNGRIRVAIDTCADDALRAAFEQAAEARLDDDTLHRAIRRV